MIRINLLPKQYRRKAVNLSLGKSGLYAFGGAAGIILMLVCITFYQTHQIGQLEDNISKAQQRAAMLQKDIQLVDALTDVKQKISARMTAVEMLDSHRTGWVRVLENISRNVPEFIWLAHFTEKAPPPVDTSVAGQAATIAPANTMVRRAEIEGYAFTLNALASFMINLMRSEYFDEVEMTSTSEKVLGDQKAYNFVLSCDLHFLSDEELRDIIAMAASPVDQNNSATHKSLN
ncbi:MAG: PilN domain-containing protein [candidate division Zixibacteria bacterium]|nr:PilN domain-containing protein [candidate division Zixibacteria bacterium]